MISMTRDPGNPVDRIDLDALADASGDRVRKRPVPLLVIGLGGAGIRALKTVKRVFAQRFVSPQSGSFPGRTAYLGIDSDCTAQDGLSSGEFVSIVSPDIAHYIDPAHHNELLTPDEQTWIHKDMHVHINGLGAGGQRQAGRLMLSRSYPAVTHAITSALTGILYPGMDDSATPEPLEVVIVTGVCGGTGAGIFLDIPQIIRHCLKTDPLLKSAGNGYRITGYMVMPDALLPVMRDTSMRRRMMAVGFAALKELDFWMGVGEHHTPYAIRYKDGPSISWDNPPYDRCMLIGGSSLPDTGNASEAANEVIAKHLLHLVADETPVALNCRALLPNYRSCEMNLSNELSMMDRPLPVGYRYCTVGACTLRLPRHKMLQYEGSLLLGTFMPPRDEHGGLVPSTRLLRECKSKVHAAYIVGDARDLYADFCQAVQLPDFCDPGIRDTARLNAMRQWPRRPHDQSDYGSNPWLSSVVNPQAGDAADAYLEQAWARFTDFAREIITDPQQGPFSLLQYLEAEGNSLRSALGDCAADWDKHVNESADGRSSLYHACAESWAGFEKPPFLNGRRAVETYLTHLSHFYDGLRKHAFTVAWARAAHRLLQRMDAFIADALKPLCHDLDVLQQRLDDPQLTAPDSADLVPFGLLVPVIDHAFREANAEGQITRDFLAHLLDCAAGSAGPDGVLTEMCHAFSRGSLDVGDRSLDALLQQMAGSDAHALERSMDSLAPRILRETQPQLLMDPGAPHVTCRCAFVPDDSPEVFSHLIAALGGNLRLLQSDLRDQVDVLTLMAGLPLHGYHLMGEMEAAYDAAMHDPYLPAGLHLVWDGQPDSDYTRNWCRLPSPCPFYLLGSKPSDARLNEWRAVQTLTARAVACGQIVLDTGSYMPAFTVRVCWADAKRTEALPGDSILQRVRAIAGLEVNPATGDPLLPEERQAMYRACLDEADTVRFSPGRSPLCMAADQRLTREPTNPYEPWLAGNAAMKAAAAENYRRLCQALAAAVIASNPRLQLIIARQAEGFEALHRAIAQP